MELAILELSSFRALRATVLVLGLSIVGCTPELRYSRSGRLEAPHPVAIAHGLGRIEEAEKTNSVEALDANYERGFRWFEVDLDITSDDALVCIHPAAVAQRQIGDLGSLSEITEAEFLERRISRRFRTQTFRQLVARLRDWPDMVLVTDSKELGKATLSRLAAHVDAVDPSLRSRIVLQMYRPEELSGILEEEARGGAFGGIVFTLYHVQISDDDLLTYVERSGLEWITMPAERFRPGLAEDLHALGARVFVHTLNDLETIHRLFDEGADGVYTDDQPPEALSSRSSPG